MYMVLWDLFSTGGFFMWPILLCSVLALAVAVWQGIRSARFRKDMDAFVLFLRSGGKQGSGVMGRIDAAEYAANPAEELALAEERVQLGFDRFGKPLELISVLGGIAPLLGFLGTVSGMISAFSSIAAADKVSVKLVAGGIAEAMVTTGFGLCVAIPCMFIETAYRYSLQGKAHTMTEELNEAVVRVRKTATGVPRDGSGA